MPIKNCPTNEQPREKLIARGAQALSDSELLAIFLCTGRLGMDVMQNARLLVDQHGPLRRLLDLKVSEMKKLPGIGVAKACELVAALELATRHLQADLERGDCMVDPNAAMRFLKQRLRDRPSEVFAALFLDTRNRTIAFEELFTGTVDTAAVYPREVARRALLHNAAAVIVSHNHPSGHPEPSAADRQITEHLQTALHLVGVRLLDHVVVGDGPPVSMAERGWMGPVGQSTAARPRRRGHSRASRPDP